MQDFVIIGGGVYGCAVAWELARRGAEVTLLEANQIASGASGGLGKRGVRANGRDARELPLMRKAYDMWETLSERLDGETGYERTGHLLLIEREIDLLTQRPQQWVQEQNGIPSRMLSQEELRAQEPNINDKIIAALYCPKDGVADHTATTRSYAAAARRLGVEIREGQAVTRLERQNGQVTAALTEQGERIEVKRSVLLATNCHCQRFVLDELGMTLPAWRIYPQVINTEPVKPVLFRHLIGHAHRTLAMKIVDGNKVMISGGWHGVVNPQIGKVEPDDEQVAGNFAEAAAVFPALKGKQIVDLSVERPELITQDDIPIIDILPGAENMIVATGWSGHGWAIAPAVASELGAWLFTGEMPATLRPFRYSRFTRG